VCQQCVSSVMRLAKARKALRKVSHGIDRLGARKLLRDIIAGQELLVLGLEQAVAVVMLANVRAQR
jgi:hypothetical protein